MACWLLLGHGKRRGAVARRAARGAPCIPLLCAPLFLLAAAPTPAAATHEPSKPSAAEAVAELNAWRAEAGIPGTVTENPDWSRGCALHNQYSEQNGWGGHPHDEDPDKPGYTPEGDKAAGNSVLHRGGSPGPRAAWEETAYHRDALLNPRLRSTGFDASHGYACMDAYQGIDDDQRTSGLALYPWPPNGTTNVPLRFEGGETPDPYKDGVPPETKQLGYLLTVGANGPWSRSPTRNEGRAAISAKSLVADGGEAVPVTASDAASPNGDYWEPGSFGLFPEQALVPSTWYTAHAEGEIRWREGDSNGPPDHSLPFNLTWRFRTAEPQPEPKPEGGGSGDPDCGSHKVDVSKRLVFERDGRGLYIWLEYCKEAKGRFVLEASQGARLIRRVSEPRSGYYKQKMALPRPGRWQVRVSFEGAEGWQGSTTTRSLDLPAASNRLLRLKLLRGRRLRVTAHGALVGRRARLTFHPYRACGPWCGAGGAGEQTTRRSLRLAAVRTVRLPRRGAGQSLSVSVYVPGFRLNNIRYPAVTKTVGVR